MVNKLKDIKFYNKDCFEGMKKIKDNSIDLILTDPPYFKTALELDKNGFDMLRLLKELKRVLKPNGWNFMFATFEQNADIINSNLFRHKFQYIWVKQNPIPNFKRAVAPLYKHELLTAFIHQELKQVTKLTFNYEAIRTKGKPYKLNKGIRHPTQFTKAQYGDIFKIKKQVDNPGFREGTTILDFPNKISMKFSERTSHPTQKPLGLFETIIKGYTKPGDLVLDPFLGSGTTAEACLKNKRKFIGFERDTEYYNIIKNRLKKSPTTIDHF